MNNSPMVNGIREALYDMGYDDDQVKKALKEVYKALSKNEVGPDVNYAIAFAVNFLEKDP